MFEKKLPAFAKITIFQIFITIFKFDLKNGNFEFIYINMLHL